LAVGAASCALEQDATPPPAIPTLITTPGNTLSVQHYSTKQANECDLMISSLRLAVRQRQRTEVSRQPARGRAGSSRLRYLFVLPGLLLYGVFVLVPLVGAFALSLTSWSGVGAIHFAGLRNYTDAFRDRMLGAAFEHTAIYSAGTTAGKLLIGLGLALLANKGTRVIAAYRTILFIPALMSFVAVGILWSWLYNPEIGLVNHALSALGVNTYTFNWLGSPSQALPALMIVEVWKWAGYTMVIFLAGLQMIPPQLPEAAMVDGAGRLAVFWYVTLPLLKPITVINLIIAVAGSLNVFDLVYVMTGGGPYYSTQTVMTYVYQEAFSDYSFGYAAAIAVLLFVLVALITVVCLRLFRSATYETREL
jgi:ABC-type sugar transport system permease subunit